MGGGISRRLSTPLALVSLLALSLPYSICLLHARFPAPAPTIEMVALGSWRTTTEPWRWLLGSSEVKETPRRVNL